MMDEFIIDNFNSPKKDLEQYYVRLSSHRRVFTYLNSYLKDLDLEDWCAGTGAFSLELCPTLRELTCVEIDIDAVSILKRNILHNKLLNVKVHHEDVLKHQPKCGNVIINPPFGRSTKLLLPILRHLLEMSVTNIMILLPVKELGVAQMIFENYKCIFYTKWDLHLEKTYSHHESENYLVHCGFAHFQSNSKIPDDVEFLNELKKYELESYLILNQMSELMEESESKHPDWDVYGNEDEDLGRNKSQELIGIRVGYILYNTFNGKLQFYFDQLNDSIFITLTNDYEMSQKKELISISQVNELIKLILNENKILSLELSDLLKSTINETFVITKCMPYQPLSRYVGCIHPWVTFVCAMTAFFCCLVSWPNKMNITVRKILCKKLLPELNSNILDQYFLSNSQKNLLDFIQESIKDIHGNYVLSIIKKMQTLTTSELSLLIKQVPELSWDEYKEFIDEETEAIEIPTMSAMVSDLTETVNKVINIYESYDSRKQQLEEFINDLNRINAVVSSHKSSMELSELKRNLSEVKEFIKNNNSLLSKKEKDTLESGMRSIDRLKDETSVDSTEPPEEIFLPEFIKRLKDEKEYNISFRELRSLIKPALRVAKFKLSKFEAEDSNKIENIIDEFFSEKNLYKRVSKTGNIKSMKSLSTLLAYIFNMIAIYDHDESFTNEDRIKLEDLREKLFVLMREGENIPVQQIVQSSRLDFTDIESYLPESSRSEFNSLFYQLTICSNYNQAWSIALRIKGLLYESFFAKTWNLIYVPEDLKHSLLSIIRQMFPNLVDTFLTRTNNHPEIRELKPDFCLVRKPLLTEGISDVLMGKDKELMIGPEIELNSAADESSVATRSVLFESAGKYSQMHELGSDEVIMKKTSEDKFFATIRNLVKYAKERNAQGGLLSSDIKIKNSNEDLTIQIDSDDDEPNEEEISSLDDIFSEEESLSMPDSKSNDSNDSSIKSSWKDYKEPDPNIIEEIAVIEVGYQTDQEGKIASDLNKWKPALQVLESLGLKLTVISAVDKTSQPNERWWLKDIYIKKLRSSISKFFYKLANNSPMDVSEHIIGDISSQKVRMTLRSGNIVRPPILSSDIYRYYISNRKNYIIRPTGAKIPRTIESDLIQSLIFGCNISSEQNYINSALDYIAENSDEIVEETKKSGNAMQICKNKNTMLEFNYGRLIEEYEMSVCNICFEKLKSLIEEFSLSDKIMTICYELQRINDCVTCLSEKCEQMTYEKNFKSRLDCIISEPMKSIGMRGDKHDQLSPQDEPAIHSQSDDDIHFKHPFDKFVNINIPLRSQKLKKLNNLKKLIIDLILMYNDLTAIKTSKGQIFICTKHDTLNRDLSILDTSTKKKLIKMIKKLKNKDGFEIEPEKSASKHVAEENVSKDSNCEESISLEPRHVTDIESVIINLILKLLEIGNELSEYSKTTCESMLKSIKFVDKPKCVLEEEWIHNITSAVKLNSNSKEFIDDIMKKQSGFKNFRMIDDRMPKLDQKLTASYLKSLSKKLLIVESKQFDIDCILMEPVITETYRRLKKTVYEVSVDVIKNLVKLFCNFIWFQEIILYSKICQLFLVFCSEFTHSGLKLRKIPHTNLNLIVKIPEKKSSNMQCWVTNSNFELLKSSTFFLNRRVATLGQSLPYCYLIVALQCIQMTHCASEIINFDRDTLELIENLSKTKYDFIKSVIVEFNNGDIIHSVKKYQNFIKEKTKFNTDMESIKDVFIETISSLNISLGCLLGPAIMLNSQLFNKYIQTIRYPFMLSLSELGFPKKLGKKMTCPRRRIEVEVAKGFTNLVCSCGLDLVEDNICQWKNRSWCPNTSLCSLTLPLFPILNDRHFVFDIYLVHIYNKELDDFGEGQIRVLEEYAERHMTWEEELKSLIERFNDCKSHIEKQELRMKMCFLLGIANLNTRKSGRDCLELLIEIYTGNNKRVYETKSGAAEEEGENDSIITESSLTSKPPSISKSKDYYRTNIEFYYKSSGTYTVNIGKGLQIERGPHTGQQEVVSPINTKIIYKPDINYLIKSILEIINNNPNHSFASYELIQLFTEVSKSKYNPGIIDRSRKSKKNWVSITNVIETTSIISEPVHYISIESALKNLKRQFSKKITKLIKMRFDHSKDARTVDQKREIINYLVEQMSEVGEVSEGLSKIIKESLVDTNNLEMDTWSNIMKKHITETLLSNDMNQLYYWIKSLSRTIKSLNMKLSQQDSQLISKYLQIISNMIKSESFDKSEVKYWLSQQEIEQIRKEESIKFKTIIDGLKLNESMKTDNNFIGEFRCLLNKCDLLREQKKKYTIINFRDEEHELQFLESEFVIKYQKNILSILNLLFVSVFISPWSKKLENSSLGLLHFSLLKGIGNNTENTDEYSNSIKVLKELVLNYSERVETQVKLENSSSLNEEQKNDLRLFQELIKFTATLFITNELPFKYIYIKNAEPQSNMNLYSKLLSEINMVLAQSDYETLMLDFFLSVITIKSRNFQSAKRLMSRSGRDKIPRSTRSKVLFELIKLVKETRQIILQPLAFNVISNDKHRNFASLAPKAQLGGDRDLLVQETGTKIIHAASELHAKSLLEHSSTDALTNPKIKEDILDSLSELKRTADIKHGNTSYNRLKSNENIVDFFRVYTCAKDHKKWGPIHCCSTFSASDQQLLCNHHDWNNFRKLVNLRNLIKLIEVSSASVEKILRSFMNSSEYEKHISNYNHGKDLEYFLKEFSCKWQWKRYIKFIIENYLSKGIVCMNSYNHMGQGIHHAESSRFADSIRVGITECCIRRFRKKFPMFNLEIKSVGSSDDLTMAFIISGSCSKEQLTEYENKILEEVNNLECLWIALSRSCQMSISEKSVISTCVNELYSDFDLYHKITPSVIKFIISTIINSTISSPMTLYQSVHVSCQQAFYMSTPYITNLAFCLFRQQIFFNHSEDFFRKYGLLLFGSISCLCRLYIPKLSTILTNALDLEDLEQTVDSISILIEYLKLMENSKAFLAHGSKKLLKEIKRRLNKLKGKQISTKDKVQMYIDSMGQYSNLNANSNNPEEIINVDLMDLQNTRETYINKLSKKNLSLCINKNTSNSRANQLRLMLEERFNKDKALNLLISRVTKFDEKIKQMKQFNDKQYISRCTEENLMTTTSELIETETNKSDKFSDILSEANTDEDSVFQDSDEENGFGSKIIATVDEMGKFHEFDEYVERFEHKARKYEKINRLKQMKKTYDSIKESAEGILETHMHADSRYCVKVSLEKVKENINFINLISKLKEQTQVITKEEVSLELTRAKLICCFLNYYDFMKNYENDKITKANLNEMHKGSFEDPFIYLLPENVKRELNKLNLFKKDIISKIDENNIDSDPARTVSINLVESNITTESLEGELHRCEQILRSRGIINSLSGGLKQESLPILRMMLRSYQFNNRFELILDDHWLNTKDSSYVASNSKISKPQLRVKFVDVVEYFVQADVFKLDKRSTKKAKYLHNMLFNSNKSTTFESDEMALLNPNILTISIPRIKSFYSETNIKKIKDEYLKNIEILTKDSMLAQNRESDSMKRQEEKRIEEMEIEFKMSNNQQILVDLEELNKIKVSIENILSTLTNFNRIQILKSEYSNTSGFLQTGEINVVKTRIFSRDSEFVLQNNLGVVAAHIIDPMGATERKPVGVKYAYLESDKNTLSSYYPILGTISNMLNDRNKSVKNRDVKKITALINNICRSVNSHNQSSTPFYAFKPSKIRQEDTTMTLVQYNIIEGLELIVEKTEPYGITFSDKYYKFCECLTIINNLPIDESRKTKLLMQLLHWSPALCSDIIALEEGDQVCNDHEIEKEIKDMYSLEPFYTQLMTESKKARSEKNRRQIMNIANLVINPSQLILESQKSDLSLLFKVEGEPYTTGRYQLSCQYGNSIGIFLNGKLCVTLDSISLELLNITEIEVIKWCFGLRTDIVSIEQHLKFLNLLTTYEDIKGVIKSGTPKTIIFRNDDTGFGLNLVDVRQNEPTLFIKHGIITNRKYKPEYQDRSPLIKWNKDHILIYLVDDTISLKESVYFRSVINIMRDLDEKTDKIKNMQYLKEQKIIIDRINLQRHVSTDTMQLMHMFFWHISELPEPLNINRKKALKKFISSKGVVKFRHSAIDEKSKEIIQEYSRFSTADISTERSLLSVKKELVDKFKITPIIDIDSIYHLEEDEIKYIDPLSKSIMTLGKNSKDYSQLYKILKYKEKVKSNRNNKSGILTLPDELSLDVVKVITDQLADQNYSIRLKEVQHLINRHFKEVSSWPYIKLLLDELNMSSLSINPTLNIIDKDLRWQLNFEYESLKTPIPKDILSILRQAKTGTIPAEFAVSCVTCESITILKDNIDKLNEYIILLRINETIVNLFIVLLLYYNEIRFDLRKITFNWLPFLNTVLPCKINYSEEINLEFSLIGRMMILKLTLTIDNETIISIRKDAENEVKELENLIDIKVSELEKLQSSTNVTKKARKKLVKTLQKTISELKTSYNIDEIYNKKIIEMVKNKSNLLKESDMLSVIDNVEVYQNLDCIIYTFTLNRYYITTTYSDIKFLQLITNKEVKYVEYMIAFTYLLLNTLFKVEINSNIEPFIKKLLEYISEKKERDKILKSDREKEETSDEISRFIKKSMAVKSTANYERVLAALKKADEILSGNYIPEESEEDTSSEESEEESYSPVVQKEENLDFITEFEAMMKKQIEDIYSSTSFGFE